MLRKICRKCTIVSFCWLSSVAQAKPVTVKMLHIEAVLRNRSCCLGRDQS